MNAWKQWLVLSTVAALFASPAMAQDEEWDDDDSLVHEHMLELDRQMRKLDEQLEGLDGSLALNFTSDFLWADDHCENKDDCDVRIVIDDGKRYVIVNGDTVETDDHPFPHHRRFAFDIGPRVHFKKFGPGKDFHRNFTWFDEHRDEELSRLEREANALARKARQAEGSERTNLETELDQKLNEIFDYKLERQEESIEKAEDRVAKLKEKRSKREAARNEIIRNRKDELLGRDRYLEW